MITLVKRFLIAIGYLLSCLYPTTFSQAWESVIAYLYTGFHIRRFKSWGRLSSMAWGVTVKGGKYISVGDNNIFLRNSVLAATPAIDGLEPEITIGSHCHFGLRNHITAVRKIIIGDYLLTGSYVLITDNAHGDLSPTMMAIPPFDRPMVSKGEVSIGHHVWIGDQVSILAGVHIGNHVVIGANSVVTHDIPDYCMAAGNPARVVKSIELT